MITWCRACISTSVSILARVLGGPPTGDPAYLPRVLDGFEKSPKVLVVAIPAKDGIQ
jgi:hypothetical protein